MNTEQILKAEKHIKYAWIAGVVSTVTTFIFSLLGTYDDTIRFKYGVDVWSLLDVALIAGLAYGIYKKNRFSALTLFLYFLISKFIMYASSGQFSGGLITVIFLMIFFQGTMATFQLHNHLIATGEKVKKKKKNGFRFYSKIIGGFVVLTAIIGFVYYASVSPEIEVIPGKQLNNTYKDFMHSEELIDENEVIQYWYSDAIIDFKDGFYFFTEKKVVVYNKQWEDPAVLMPLKSIVDIEFERDSTFWNDSRITLYLEDETIVFFPVSSEYDGDVKFYNRLYKLWTSIEK